MHKAARTHSPPLAVALPQPDVPLHHLPSLKNLASARTAHSAMLCCAVLPAGRSLRVATVTVCGRKVLVATSHLESPIPPQQWFSRVGGKPPAAAVHAVHVLSTLLLLRCTRRTCAAGHAMCCTHRSTPQAWLHHRPGTLQQLDALIQSPGTFVPAVVPVLTHLCACVLQERQQQMGFSLTQLSKAPYGNVLFAGGARPSRRVPVAQWQPGGIVSAQA